MSTRSTDTYSGAEEARTIPNSSLKWYAVYTHPRCELEVAERLRQSSIEAYVPSYYALKQLNNGKRTYLEQPLFPSYLFVHLTFEERNRIPEVPGVVRLVGVGGDPVPMADGEVEALREYLALRLKAEPHEYTTTGTRIRLRSGPLAGLEGILVRHRGRLRVVLTLELLMRSVVVELGGSIVEPVIDAD